MRIVLLVAWLALARAVGAACLDDCLAEYGGAGEEYADCVADCGVCGNEDLEGDEECDDGNTVGGDCCDANCQPEPAGSPCDDGDDEDLCATDVCDGDGECEAEDVPATDCRTPVEAGGATLAVRDADDDRDDLLVWKWRRGQATSKRELGDPTAGTTYALCVYDASGLLTTVTVPAEEPCGSRSCWTEKRGGWKYRNPDGEPEGAVLLSLHQGRRDGRTRIVVEAAGENLDLPDLGTLESPVTAQLRRSGSRVCWSARFGFPPARRNGAVHFRDRSDRPEPPPVSTTTVPSSTTSSTTSVPASSTTTITTPGGGTTSTTLPGAIVEVAVVDAASIAVADAEVTITYAGGQEEVSDFTDGAGVVVFAGQPVGVAATVAAEDDDFRVGSIASPGFQAGANRLTVTVR